MKTIEIRIFSVPIIQRSTETACKRAEEEISIASKALFGTGIRKSFRKGRSRDRPGKKSWAVNGRGRLFYTGIRFSGSDSKRRRKRNFIWDIPPSFMASAGESIRGLEIREKPENPFRMLNMWDNIDGTIERGYAGNSFLYEKGEIQITDRTRDFARLMALWESMPLLSIM